MADKVTAGRDALGEFAPTFAALNDDVLFGQVWAREDELSPRLRSIVTVITLITFVGIVIWAWSGRNRARFEEAARLPLESD